jgi:hypothetical protein
MYLIVGNRNQSGRVYPDLSKSIGRKIWNTAMKSDNNPKAVDIAASRGLSQRHWRAATTPIRRLGTVTHSKTITSIVTPDDFESEPDAQFAAEKMIRKL